MVKRIKLKESHVTKAKQLRIYMLLMKMIEGNIRARYSYYMNSQKFIDQYNKHILMLNNKSWHGMILITFLWGSINENEEYSNKDENEKWHKIATHFSK